MTLKSPKSVLIYIKIIATSLISIIFLLILVPAVFLTYAISVPIRASVCCQTPADFGAAYEKISFFTQDGLKLSGWYVPAPANSEFSQSVIILVHSYYADRRQTLPVAQMLYRSGYGLLMYDQRASGESQGGVRSLGWRDIPDLNQAAEWLLARNRNFKIGVYGCSMGGAIALAGSVNVPDIRAVIADAPSPLQWYENLPEFSAQDPISLPIIALYYPLLMLRSGTFPPTSTLDAVRNMNERPILFISSGQSAEYARIETYFQAALGPKEHWNLPTATHCSGPGNDSAAYQKHLLNFFKNNLP
ncbi:MAG: alpha/beta hydrolase [Chloroflexota bacterium]